MKISNSTGKSKDFYNRGKAMFDQIPPVTQAIPQIPQERSSKYMTVFELIEANGLTLHGDIEHFAALVAAAEREACLDVMMQSAAKGIDTAIALEREACAKVCEEVGVWPSLEPKHCADAIRARGQA